MISILTDNANLLMQTNLNKATNRLDLIMSRLSSGCRINSAKDDAAGLAIASSLESSIRGLNQASSNAQMGAELFNNRFRSIVNNDINSTKT